MSMTTKVGLGLVVVLIILGLGYYGLTQARSSAPSTSQTTSDTGQQAKINIDAVCQGALAYMTFPSGAEADAFVKDCKEGKHPEVIDKYKADMNLGTGAAI